MKKEYVTARLFKNNRAADCLITEEELQELHDSDQQQATEALNNSLENNETVESNANPNKSSLSQRLLSVIKRALAILADDLKG